MKTPAVLREAARRIEAREEGLYSPFPCLTIVLIDGEPHYTDNTHALSFMSVFSSELDSYRRSSNYLDNIGVYSSRDEVILSLCFAAAIIEAGDAP